VNNPARHFDRYGLGGPTANRGQRVSCGPLGLEDGTMKTGVPVNGKGD
jgi:hypothetical protein